MQVWQRFTSHWAAYCEAIQAIFSGVQFPHIPLLITLLMTFSKFADLDRHTRSLGNLLVE